MEAQSKCPVLISSECLGTEKAQATKASKLEQELGSVSAIEQRNTWVSNASLPPLYRPEILFLPHLLVHSQAQGYKTSIPGTW